MLKKLNKYQSGITLPVTILFLFISSGILFSFILTVYEKDFQVEYKIAQTKALYNAESGIALGAYTTLYKKDYIPNETADSSSYIYIDDMGYYSIGLFEGIDPELFQPIRGANSTGYAKVKHVLGLKEIEIQRNKVLNLGHNSSLSDYLWLTDSELAGGAPWSFDNGTPSFNTRRENNWGSGDQLNASWEGDPICDVGFKTNGTFVTSQFGVPSFDITVSVVEDENGDVHYPDIQSGSASQIFQGEPALDTVKTTCLPPPGYETMKRVIENSNEHFTFDATEKLNYNSATGSRDTLIMTDIEFFVENAVHGFRVKQFWFLKPPYFKEDYDVGYPYMFNALIENFSTDCPTIGGQYDIRTCPNYIEQLENFHSKTINVLTGDDSFIAPDYWGIVSSTHGFHHHDFPYLYNTNGQWISQFEIDQEQPFNSPDQLLPEYMAGGGVQTYNYSQPTAIYVKGGPVRVHGRYKGRYTVVTDEYTPYHRHAWLSTMGATKIDTLWNNIWITDDLINDDAANGTYSLFNAQPDEECNDGTENNMGLVSGANVFVANTEKNGAHDGGYNNCNDNFCDINIHAHIIAFNESFAAHYWQNTYNSNNGYYSKPPYGDGQGIQIYGNSGNDDTRGKINLWGGVVQKFRGYIVRNNPGPYNLPQGNIGYDSKDYNFDCNLKCSFPPLYPENTTCDESAEELPWSVTAYY